MKSVAADNFIFPPCSNMRCNRLCLFFSNFWESYLWAGIINKSRQIATFSFTHGKLNKDYDITVPQKIQIVRHGGVKYTVYTSVLCVLWTRGARRKCRTRRGRHSRRSSGLCNFCGTNPPIQHWNWFFKVNPFSSLVSIWLGFGCLSIRHSDAIVQSRELLLQD